MSEYYQSRHRRNDESRNHAAHYREPWTVDEVAFLLAEWPKATTGEDEAVVAEILERTIEACRQRYYEARRGMGATTISRVTVTVTEEKRYIGACDDPDECWWDPTSHNK